MQQYRRVAWINRCQILALFESNIRISEIARRLKYHRSTIYRELRRNSGKKYCAFEADRLAINRFKRCRRKRRMMNLEIKRSVLRGLEAKLSPAQISGRMKIESGGQISHQTIYDEINNHRPDLKIHLRRFGRRRGRGRQSNSRREKPSWMRSVHDRPKHVLQRRQLGHWERDTMFGADRETAFVCLERKSRYVLVQKMKQPYTKNFAREQRRCLKGFEIKSMTNDNGNEFLDGLKFGAPVYYCDPKSPHQKGSVENVIGLLRQFLPKGVDLKSVSAKRVRKIQNMLNNRPRKCLGFRTPHEILFKTTVALGI